MLAARARLQCIALRTHARPLARASSSAPSLAGARRNNGPTAPPGPAAAAAAAQAPRPAPKPSRGATQLPPRPSIPEADLTEVFLCGSGPGGQKINKTASAVQLTHLPTGTVLKCQATRSRIQNRKIARRLLAERVEFLEKGGGARVEIKREHASKRKKSGEKKRRRKYRALEAGRAGVANGRDAAGEEEDDAEDEVEDEGEDEGDGGAVGTLTSARGPVHAHKVK